MIIGLTAGEKGTTVIQVKGKFLTKLKLKMISRRQEWPFNVDKVFVGTFQKSPKAAVVFVPETNKLFALNGVARHLKIPNCEEIWKVRTEDKDDNPTVRYDLGYVIKLALKYGKVKDEEVVGNDSKTKSGKA